MEKTFYHTQEARGQRLTAPLPCTRDDAWLGEAIYFWHDLEDAEHWGNTSKRKTGVYQVYSSNIDCEDVLNTVFNEEDYFFWLRQIEKAAKTIIAKTKEKPTLKELNDYFRERAGWREDVSGIMFQDLPTNPNHLLIKPIQYGDRKVPFAYRKRIQLAVYRKEIVCTFAFLKEEKCF